MACAGQGVSRKLGLDTKEAASSFAEWASLFSGELFVKAVAYVDESGTHDRTGTLRGSAHAVIVGLVDRRDGWIRFCDRWQVVLDKYSAPYFHYKEWTAASRVVDGKITSFKDFKKNPYQNWKREQLDSFLMELAEITGEGNKVIVGGWVDTDLIHKAMTGGTVRPENAPAGGDPYQHCLNQFFENVTGEISSAWPGFNQPVSFFYDWTDDPIWKRSIMDAHDAARKKDPRIRELTFANKKDAPHSPLQAADMVAYRFRQLIETYRRGTVPLPNKLDKLILSSMFNQFRSLSGLPKF